MLEEWSKKYIALALGALLCINGIVLGRYFLDSKGKGHTLRLLLRTFTTTGPHGNNLGEADTFVVMDAQ